MRPDTLTRMYRDFNARQIDAVLDLLHPDVDWQNGWEGGRLHGREEVRDYWTRQWTAIDPTVDPVGFDEDGEGRTIVHVHQVVRSLKGEILGDEHLDPVYEIRDGLIRTMEIRK